MFKLLTIHAEIDLFLRWLAAFLEVDELGRFAKELMYRHLVVDDVVVCTGLVGRVRKLSLILNHLCVRTISRLLAS